jgi:predicted metal-dependent phosphoesterase TrpH
MTELSCDVRTLNADLHCHSTVSDGTLSPAALAERACRHGVELWSLTDHDEIRGQAEAARAAEALGLRYVAGVEISVTWAGETLHIVGLRIDWESAVLTEGLESVRSGRARRARAIAEQLAAVGIPGAFEGALGFVGNPDLISRTHFARFLVESGVCPDVHAVFSNYLVKGRPGYVPITWASLGDALGWIQAAGGAAVVAHPGRYHLSRTALHEMLGEFKERGGQGLEVVTGSHSVDQYREYAAIAREFGFLASRGSDFHGPGESHTELGMLPALPDSLTPIWHDWF